jgi:hypothetical protein
MAHDKKSEEKHEKQAEHDFYMKIENSVAFRRNLLEASKSTLGMLKEVYVVKQLNNKKHEKTAELQKELKELRVLVQKMNEMLPDYAKAEIKKHFPDLAFEKKIRAEPDSRSEPEPTPKKPLSELDQLSKALGDIQKKLSSL